MIDWKLVLEKTFIPEWLPLRLFPITADLDQFEAETGFRLPKSFREFGMTFGAGEINPGEWHFAMPGIPVVFENIPGSAMYKDPATLTRSFMDGGPLDEDEYDDLVRAQRLVLFCKNEAFDYFGWDPLDVIDPDLHEYGIYMLGRNDTRVMRLATRFHRFVLTYCFRGLMDIEDDDEADCEKCEYLEYLVEETDRPLRFCPSRYFEE